MFVLELLISHALPPCQMHVGWGSATLKAAHVCLCCLAQTAIDDRTGQARTSLDLRHFMFTKRHSKEMQLKSKAMTWLQANG